MKKEYNPVITLRNRDIDPELIYENKEGKAVINDPDLHFILKFFRKSVKRGLLLNLGAGITHVHYMCALEDKLSHITALDISDKNNRLITELLESSQNKKKTKIIEEIDLITLAIMAQALVEDKSYGLKKKAEEILPSIYKKSLYQDKLDLITADMIEQMEDLGSGKLIDGRKYDNILLAHSIYYRNEGELIDFIKNIKKCLKPKGRIIIIDTAQYNDNKDSKNGYILQEDEKVMERYGSMSESGLSWQDKDIKYILQRADFKKIKVKTYEISASSKAEKECFDKYLCASAEK